ncbi:MAG: phosphatidylglycerol lysyltransferase domain-containing protein [Pseudomonadota bacterium]|nr:phosphatidylglycerol lysyltransferase domain-containing protein [Pseudomonadota bacterium]
MEAVPEVRALTPETFPVLRRAFGRHTWEDPYAGSPAYLAVTGRHGLWLYSDGAAFLIFCRHPDQADAALIFPPSGPGREALLARFLDQVPAPPGGFQLARIPAHAAEDMLSAFSRAAAGHSFAVRPEDRLDWRYPVHILDTAAVAAAEGHRLRDFRHNLHRAARAGLRAEPLEIARHSAAITQVVRQWASVHANDNWTASALAAPFEAVFDQLRTGRLPLHGLIVTDGAALRGFITWEETDPGRGMANSLTNLAIGPGKGASELTFQAMCQVLERRGFARVCVGGSEREGLDRFKRKMQPVRSVPMVSADIVPLDLAA